MATISGRKTAMKDVTEMEERIRELETQLKVYQDAEAQVRERLERFTTLILRSSAAGDETD